MNRSVLIAILIIVVLAIVAGVVSFYQSTGVEREVTTPQSLETQGQ
jgi:flagellar basal body-associated protein FliL